jgi:hypothetical protein
MSIHHCEPVRDEYTSLWTCPRWVHITVNLSEISTHHCVPVRDEYTSLWTCPSSVHITVNLSELSTHHCEPLHPLSELLTNAKCWWLPYWFTRVHKTLSSRACRYHCLTKTARNWIHYSIEERISFAALETFLRHVSENPWQWPFFPAVLHLQLSFVTSFSFGLRTLSTLNALHY